jgi:hypothetical protein
VSCAGVTAGTRRWTPFLPVKTLLVRRKTNSGLLMAHEMTNTSGRVEENLNWIWEIKDVIKLKAQIVIYFVA